MFLLLLCWQRLYRLPRLVQRSEFEFPHRIHHVVRSDDVVAGRTPHEFCDPKILIASFSLTPAFRRLRTAERRMSCNVCPEYSGSYGRPSTSVSVPSPQAAQASIHSFRRFVSKTFVEDAVPGFGSICPSILTSSDDKGTILPSSPLVCSGFNRSCHCQFLRQSGFHSPSRSILESILPLKLPIFS